MLTKLSDRKPRIEWIDVAKGILIFCVCIGHRSSNPAWLTKWIYTFHMPAFFMISGYLTNFGDLDFKSYLVKKLKQLMVPYCILGAIYIFFSICFDYFYSHEITLLNYLKSFFSGSGIGSTWFIIALFIVEMIAWLLHRLDEPWRVSLVLLITILGFYYNSIIDEQPIFNLAAVPIGLFFFEMAWLWKKYKEDIRNKLTPFDKIGGVLIANIILIIGSFISLWFNGRVDMVHLEYGNIFLFLLGAFCGTGLIVYLSKLIVKYVPPVKRVFSYYGQNTLPIIAFHYPLGYMVLETLAYKITKVPYGETIFSGNIEGVLYAVAVMILMIPVIEVLNRFFPWAVGKRNKKVA